MHARRTTLLAATVAFALAAPLALAEKKADLPKGEPTPVATPALDRKDPLSEADKARAAGHDAAPTDATDADDIASTPSAARTNPGKGNWWTDADGDNDGRLSRAESEANDGLSSRFASIDADADGFVTRAEYQAFYTANAAQGAAHATDHSAVVGTDVYERFDANDDGRLTATEIAADARLTTDFAAADADDDGFVTEAEFRAFYKQD